MLAVLASVEAEVGPRLELALVRAQLVSRRDDELSAELVTLSACQTGLGKEVRGEGLVGLTRGFMYAGAPRVVVSLWNVSDEATAELMTRFYRGIFEGGLRPAKALQAAQAAMSQDARFGAPYFWAAFTLQGEWR